MPNLRQPTRYDEMLNNLRIMSVALPSPCKEEIGALADCWGTYEKTQYMNGPAVADKDSPTVQAQKVIDWKCNNGPRPTWLKAITDEELTCS